jgi:DNA-directed RNA polymerase specialized sigma24 family protein
MEKKTDRIRRICRLSREIKYLKELIRKTQPGIVVDWANDYSTGRARPITLLGQSDVDEYCRRLEKTVDLLNHEMRGSEDLIMQCKDPTTRSIVRMRYIEGKTVEDVAKETGYSVDTIKWRLKTFFSKL